MLLGLIAMVFIAGGVSGALAMTFATTRLRHCKCCRSRGEPLLTYVPEARPPTPAPAKTVRGYLAGASYEAH